jgi:hypothetical protein
MRNPALIAALLLAPAIALAATKNARLAEQFRRADADGNGMLSRAGPAGRRCSRSSSTPSTTRRLDQSGGDPRFAGLEGAAREGSGGRNLNRRARR